MNSLAFRAVIAATHVVGMAADREFLSTWICAFGADKDVAALRVVLIPSNGIAFGVGAKVDRSGDHCNNSEDGGDD
jgi:hypothetical protein